MSFTILCLLNILFHVPCAEAGGLRHPPLPAKMDRSDVESLLMGELSNAFRGGAAREHISSLEVELTGMYTAMPKSASGGLGHASVRFMLNRFFLQKHGWFIRGLEPANFTATQKQVVESLTQSKNQSLQEWVPGYLQDFIEETQDGRGIKLRELAVLAATIEDLIHKESNQRLEMTFSALELPVSSQLDANQFGAALEVYLMIYLLGGDFSPHMAGESLLEAQKRIPDYDGANKWMDSLKPDIGPDSIRETIDFAVASRVVEEVGKHYGTYNDVQCGDLKSELLQIESTKAGRVRLADFYKKGLSGVFAFTEKIEYLRALGTLDESNTSEPYVIIPNYVAGRQNCLRASDFYLVCCRSECEDLFASVEKNFNKPTATPDQILGLVASFSTKTVEVPRMLSDSLVRRLNSIADAHRGQVPIHGRLFAQWMHHAFPRECPYPQQSGDVAAMTPEQWMAATGYESAQKTSEEMQFIVDSDSSILPVGEIAREHHDLAENELPWDEVEELLHPGFANDVVSFHASPQASQRSLFNKALPVFFILGAAAFAWKMKRNMKVSQWRDGLMV